MIEFPEVINIPLAKAIDSLMDWLLLHLGGFFDVIGAIILHVVQALESLLLFTPWFVIILLVGLAGWKLLGKISTAITFMLMMFVIGAFGYWDLAMRTLI